jgi:hypothetical protein
MVEEERLFLVWADNSESWMTIIAGIWINKSLLKECMILE